MTNDIGFTPTEKMLDPTSLAEMLRISERHLTDVRREDNAFPQPRMLGTLPRWNPAVIRRWMDQPITVASETAEAAPVAASAGGKGSNKARGNSRVQ